MLTVYAFMQSNLYILEQRNEHQKHFYYRAQRCTY